MLLENFHTHSTFCDGKSKPEDIVLSAIDKGFHTLGFSGHGYTPHELTSCMTDLEGYIAEISRLKEKYRDRIKIHLGIEEDSLSPVDRCRFDYIIGSSHCFLKDGVYYPIDLSFDHFKRCLDVFNYDITELAEAYYSAFCSYIKQRRPDIIGHFDLITKYDELDNLRLLSNDRYNMIAEKYLLEATKYGCIFEVNTGAISRGLRTSVYPSENLLHLLKKHDAHITISSDSHHKDTLDFYFEETRRYLYDIGFREIYTPFGKQNLHL